MTPDRSSPEHLSPEDDLKRILQARPPEPSPPPETPASETPPPKPPRTEPEPPSDRPPGKPRKQSVVLYLTVMFAAAFLMLLLAYFIQQRNNAAIIGNLQTSVDAFATLDELREENEALRERADRADELEQELAELQAEHQQLSRTVEQNEQDMQTLEQDLEMFRNYCQLENQLRKGYYEAAADRLTFLYENRLSYNLHLGLIGLEPDDVNNFDLVARLNEIALELEGMGLLEPDTVVF